MGIEQWSTTANSNVNANTGITWDENMAPSGVNDAARSTMAAIREWYEDAEWIKLGENGSATAYSISYVSATVFKFSGTDRRTIAPSLRRVKCGVGAGVIYGTIDTCSLSASDTQVTCTFDSGQLDASLSFVSLGVITPTSSSLLIVGTQASTFTFDGSGGSTGSLTMTYRRIGKFVNLNIPAATATTGTSSTKLVANTALPTSIRPVADQFCVITRMLNNAGALTPSGMAVVRTTGVVEIFRDGSGTTVFTDGASAGMQSPQSISYFIG